MIHFNCLFFFFFQAEDGIRDLIVTGVQTCALPILDGSMLLRINVNRVHFERLLREQGLTEEELVVPAPTVAGDDGPSYNSQRSHDASHQ